MTRIIIVIVIALLAINIFSIAYIYYFRLKGIYSEKRELREKIFDKYSVVILILSVVIDISVLIWFFRYLRTW